jgi:hypothetical protein
VYGAPREWDRENKQVVETSLICADDLEHAARLLKPHVAKPKALAQRLVEYAQSDEDPARVARALAKETKEPAAGQAEEAAAYVRIFLGHVKWARGFGMGIAWELRTAAACECAVQEGTTPGKRVLPKWLFETRDASLRCKKCGAIFAYEATRDSTTVTRQSS